MREVEKTQYPQQLSSTPQTNHSSQPYSLTYEAPHHPQQYQHAYHPQISQPTPSVPQNAYHSPLISQQPPVKFPQIDSGLVVLVFLPRDDLIACLNKAMEFMSTVVASHFPLTNNQLRTSSNLQNQATIQDGRVTVKQVQGRQVQSSSLGTIGHMARQCTQPKRPRNAAWFKEKLMLAEAHESGLVLDEEQLAFLADPGITDCHDVQPTIIHNAAFQTDDLDAYDSDCDDISSAKVVLMANLSSYGSDVLSEVPQNTPINMIICLIKVSKRRNQTVNESLPAELERYKERVKTLEQRFNVDLNSREKLIDSQMDDEIRNSFDKVVKVRTTPDAITEGSWGFEHTKKVFKEEVIPFINSLRASFKDFENGLHNELNEVKTVFKQMKAAVEQCSIDKKYFDIQKKEVSLDNDRLLDHIICQDVMNIVMHVDSVLAKVLPADNKCLVNDNLEIERLEQENNHLFELLLSQDIVHICVNSLASRNDCREMQQ
ncbi:hypothetical protein Tco_1137054, partial [Tanacetum coccineum]